MKTSWIFYMPPGHLRLPKRVRWVMTDLCYPGNKKEMHTIHEHYKHSFILILVPVMNLGLLEFEVRLSAKARQYCIQQPTKMRGDLPCSQKKPSQLYKKC